MDSAAVHVAQLEIIGPLLQDATTCIFAGDTKFSSGCSEAGNQMLSSVTRLPF